MNEISLGVYFGRFSNSTMVLQSTSHESILMESIINKNPSIATLQNQDVLMIWESSLSLSYSQTCTYTCNSGVCWQYGCFPYGSLGVPCGTFYDTFGGTTISQDGSGFGIFARLLSSSGGFYGISDFQINTYANGDQRYPMVSAFQDSSSIVVWQSIGQDSSGWGIFGQQEAKVLN